MSGQPKGARPDDEAEERDAEVPALADEAKPRLRGKALAIAGGLAGLLLFAGCYLAIDYFGILDGSATTAQANTKPVHYYDLPELVVNLSATEQRAQYLKVKIALEVDDARVLQAIEPVMPRVLDMFQLYLRELRTSDLDGSAGVFRLKEELLRRVNMELQQGRVNRVLFKEIIVQ
jgi:flagellar FliL protein